MKKRALYPGSFDPLTYGHLDLIRRGLRMFDEVLVAVLANPSKKPVFNLKERVSMIRGATAGLKGARIETFDGLLADYVRHHGNPVVLRGLRVVSDFEYEFQMALMNRKLHPGFEVVFMTPDERFSYLSSSLVWQVAALGGSVRAFVPPLVASAIQKKIRHPSR
jgi:pantetheine-phosphate adenylyltransferase